jgi:ADP-ribose pyrophosphatase YjhB (NUDIX family)
MELVKVNKRVSGRAIIIENDEVYLMFRRRIKDGITTEYYAIPGGGKEENETIEECVAREIKEEFNLDIEVKELLGTVEDEKNIGYIYNTKLIGGDFKLSGEELERNTPENYYEVRKVNINDIDKINLFEENKEMIRKAYRKDK